MEEKTQSLTTRGINTSYCLLIIFSVIGGAISLYLSNHYMEVKFPQGLFQTSACDINSFFNCDASSLSALSNIFGLPISTLGFLFCINLIASCMFPHENWERANHLLSWINVLGCLILFLYTLISLKSMCPFCIAYWATSLAIAFLFWKKGLTIGAPSPLVMAIYLGLALVVIGGFSWNIANKQKSNHRLASALIMQFNRRPLVKKISSPHKIHMSTEDFQKAPLRISKFSDFQCPSCSSFAEKMPALIKRYKGKINIQYLFYPLDHHCNDKIKNPFHPLSCQAAFLAHCSGEKFSTIHDEIFATQKDLTQTWIDQKAKEGGLENCQKSLETLKFVKGHIQLGNELGVTSTPTLIVNGKKIPGSLPLQQLYLLFDQILK